MLEDVLHNLGSPPHPVDHIRYLLEDVMHSLDFPLIILGTRLKMYCIVWVFSPADHIRYMLEDVMHSMGFPLIILDTCLKM